MPLPAEKLKVRTVFVKNILHASSCSPSPYPGEKSPSTCMSASINCGSGPGAIKDKFQFWSNYNVCRLWGDPGCFVYQGTNFPGRTAAEMPLSYRSSFVPFVPFVSGGFVSLS